MKSNLRSRFLTPVALASLLAFGSLAVSIAQQAASSRDYDAARYPQSGEPLPGKGPRQTWNDFPKVWAQRFAEWRPGEAGDKGAVVFLGDSITQGWTGLAQDFPNLRVANRGISGDTTRGVLYRLRDVIVLGPDAVVLLIGTNDIGLGADPADVADNVREILRQLRESNPDLPVIVCRVMPRGDRNLHAEQKLKKLNALVDELVSADPKCLRCDTWGIYADDKDQPSKEEFPDLLHPNAAGYAKWAGALKPLLAELKLKQKTSP
jgi:lysophospholipase L1-like esterase